MHPRLTWISKEGINTEMEKSIGEEKGEPYHTLWTLYVGRKGTCGMFSDFIEKIVPGVVTCLFCLGIMSGNIRPGV